LISATLPIAIGDRRFPVKVFKEATRETIFSKGEDRAKVADTWFPGDDDYSDNREIDPESPLNLQCLSASQHLGRTFLSEIQRSKRMEMDSKTPVFNDDFPRQQDNLGKSSISKSGEPISGKKGTAGASLGINVSPADKNPVETLMAEGMLGGERREDSNSHLNQQPPTLMLEDEPDKLEVFPGPHSQLDCSQPIGLNRSTYFSPRISDSANLLGGLGAITPGAKCSKPKIRNKKIKKKGPNNNHPDGLSIMEVNPSTCETTVQTEISVGSLHDSNIENMNHILLNKYNQTTAKEI
ncbi:hypothetical protein Ancab_006089, partial [Ancistrocladus abbreviatus]